MKTLQTAAAASREGRPVKFLCPRSIEALLAERYALPHYAFLEQVRASAGWDIRTCDALAMGLWKSIGLHLHGFEIKRDKRDLTRELAQPEKAEAVARFCDFWWLVADDPKVYNGVEVPMTWGILVRKGDALKVERPACQLADPTPVTRGFLARILKGTAEASVPMRTFDDAIAKRLAEHATLHQHDVECAREEERDAAQVLRESVAAFEVASGVKIQEWRGGQIGAAVKAVLALGLEHSDSHLNEIANLARSVVRDVEAFQQARRNGSALEGQ